MTGTATYTARKNAQAPAALRSTFVLIAALILLLLGGAALLQIRQPDITRAEALILWMVEDARELAPAAPSDVLRIVSDNARQTLNRTRSTAHMPLYPLLLEAWGIFFGDDVLLARVPSVWLALLGLSLLMGLVRRITRSKIVALIAALLVGGTAALVPVTLYAASTAEPVALLFASGVLTVMVFVRWVRRPTLLNGLAYVVALALAFATHTAAALLIAGMGLVQSWRIIQHIRGQDTGFSLIALYDALRSVQLSTWMMLSALGALPLLAWSFVVEREQITVSGAALGAALSAAPLMLAVIAVFAAPLALIPINQRTLARYTLVMTGGLIVLWGISVLWLPVRPPYSATLDEVYALRSPAEPALISYAPHSIAAYFDRVRPFSAGMAVDVGWRERSFEELVQIVENATRGGAPLWLMLPEADPQRGELVEAVLQEGYTADTCQAVDGMLFHRYMKADEGSGAGC